MKKKLTVVFHPKGRKLKKVLLIMRISFILIFAAVFNVTASVYSQSVRVDLDLKEASLEIVFQSIQDQTEFDFFYKNEYLPMDKAINKTYTNAKVNDVLDEVLDGTGLVYRVLNKNIVITKEENSSTDREESIAQQQTKTITGKVTDENGQALPGVAIIIPGTTTGTTSKPDGTFELIIPSNTNTLSMSFIGFKSQEIQMGTETIINVKMEQDVIGLDEVVAIGYGTVKKSDLTGSVTKVKAEKFDTQQAANLLQYLTGTVAGVNVNNSTSASENSSIEVRGPTSLNANNAPLIVLDGVIFNGNISDINPNDIESVDILKDASSAAVFGSRSASGVVIITTKKGSGDKITINLSSQLGITGTTNEIRSYDPDGYLKLRQDFLRRVNPSFPGAYFDNPNALPMGISLDEWQKYDATVNPDPQDAWMNRLKLREIEKKNIINGKTLDWFDEAMRTGIRQNYDVSLSGGTDVMKYYWSAGYTDNENYILGDDYKIIRTRLNTDAVVTNYLKVGMNAQFSSRDESNVPISLNGLVQQSPYGEMFNEDATLKWYPHDDTVIPNPFMNYYNYDKFNKGLNLFANIYGELTLPLGFSFKTSYINRFDLNKNYYYNPSTTPAGNTSTGYAQRINSSLYEWQIDNILTWKKKIGVHDFNVTLLYNSEKRQTWRDNAENIGFYTSEALTYHQLNSGSSPTIVNNDTYSTGTAAMGRLNYVLMNKYFMTLTFRRDGYSAFGQLNPYANFPSAAIAWNIKNENFFQADWVTNLKLRFSYGVNGNRDIGIYDALAQLGTTKYLSGTTVVSGIYSATMANADLRWERTTALNGGADFGLFDGRISGSVEVYKMKTTDLLLLRSLPAIIGYKSVMSNMGQLDNKGFELTVDSRNYHNNDFSWNSSVVFSFNRNEIVHLYGEMVDILDKEGNIIGQKEADDRTNGWFIGESLDRIWDYKALGIWQLGEEDLAKSFGKAPGDVKLNDQDGNGVSTQEDKEFLGYKQPRYHLGLRNDVSFLKNFKFSCFIRADLGQMGTNGLLMHKSQSEDRQNAWDMPYWTPTNPINTATRLNTVDTPVFTLYESRSFVRLQDASLSYNIPRSVIDKIKINRCRVYLSGRNIITYSKWSGWDPESGNTPMPRTYTFGIDLTL